MGEPEHSGPEGDPDPYATLLPGEVFPLPNAQEKVRSDAAEVLAEKNVPVHFVLWADDEEVIRARVTSEEHPELDCAFIIPSQMTNIPGSGHNWYFDASILADLAQRFPEFSSKNLIATFKEGAVSSKRSHSYTLEFFLEQSLRLRSSVLRGEILLRAEWSKDGKQLQWPTAFAQTFTCQHLRDAP